MTNPLVRADCKIMETSIHAREGYPAYIARAVFKVLEVATAEVQYMLCGTGFPTIGNEGGLWRQVPGGAWNLQATFSGGYEAIRALLRTQDGMLIAATRWEGSIWTSRDEGLSWTHSQDIGNEKECMCLCESSETGALLLGTARDAEIWRSVDGGFSWSFMQTLETPPGDNYVYSIVEAADGNFLAGGIYPNVGTHAQVWRSVTDGVTWTLADTLVGANYVTSMVVAADRSVVAGCHGGAGAGEFWRSTDNGLNWVYIQDMVGNTSPYRIVLMGDGSLIAGSYDWGGQVEIWRSSTHGASWSKISEVSAGVFDVCWSLALDHDGALVGGFKRTDNTDCELWRSTDGGWVWEQLVVLTGYPYPESLLRVP